MVNVAPRDASDNAYGAPGRDWIDGIRRRRRKRKTMRRRDAQLIRARREPRKAVFAVAIRVMRAAAVDDIGSGDDRCRVCGRAVVAGHLRRRTAAVEQQDRRAVDRLSGARNEYAADRIEHRARLCMIGGVRRVHVVRGQRHVQPAADRAIVRNGGAVETEST